MEYEGCSVRIAQLCHGQIDSLPKLFALKFFRGISVNDWHLPFHTARFLVHLFDGIELKPLLSPEMIEAKVDYDPGHPSHKACFTLELPQPLPPFHPSFLGKIARLVLVANHAEGASINLVSMPKHQPLEGFCIAILGCPHQLFIAGGRLVVLSRHCFDAKGC